MNPPKPKKETLEKQVKYDLPESYYSERELSLTRNELDKLLELHYEYLCSKMLSNVKVMLRNPIARDEVYDFLGDVLLSTLKRHEAGRVQFYSAGKFIAYLLRAGWRALSSSNKKKTKLVQLNQEGDIGNLEFKVIGLDSVAEFSSAPRATRGSQDLRDDYKTGIWTALWETLEDAVVKGELQFRDVAIYKHYILHKYLFILDGTDKPYFTINKMVAEGEFSRKQITNSLQVMNTYVERYVKEMNLPTDIEYEEEAEDIFGY